MSETSVYLILLFVYCAVMLGSMYAGIRTSHWNTPRLMYWLGVVSIAVISSFSSLLTEEVFSNETSGMGVVSIAAIIDLIVTGLFGFYWGMLAAGRAINMGRSRNFGWISVIPLIGILWLGIAGPGAPKAPDNKDDKPAQT